VTKSNVSFCILYQIFTSFISHRMRCDKMSPFMCNFLYVLVIRGLIEAALFGASFYLTTVPDLGMLLRMG